MFVGVDSMLVASWYTTNIICGAALLLVTALYSTRSGGLAATAVDSRLVALHRCFVDCPTQRRYWKPEYSMICWVLRITIFRICYEVFQFDHQCWYFSCLWCVYLWVWKLNTCFFIGLQWLCQITCLLGYWNWKFYCRYSCCKCHSSHRVCLTKPYN